MGVTADQLARDMRDAATVPRPADAVTLLLNALGGADNIATATALSSRLLVSLLDPALADAHKIDAAVPRGAVETTGGAWQIVIGPGANEMAVMM